MYIFSSEQQKYYKVTCSISNTFIENSHEIKSIKGMKDFLLKIQSDARNNVYNAAIYKRTISGMIIEWRAHNLLYALGVKKERTGSVDLNLDVHPFFKICYFILSLLYLRY